jgi:hypothetical protein
MKYFVAIIILLLSFSAFAQEQYVEVMVSDTVEVEPEVFFYSIVLQDLSSGSDSTTFGISDKPPTAPALPADDRLQQLQKLIRLFKIDTVAQNNLDLMDHNYYSVQVKYLLRFTSREKMNAFVTAIGKIEGINGGIKKLINTHQEIYYDRLYKKLLVQARGNATQLAQESGKTLGPVIQVKEVPSDVEGGWTMYPPLSSLVDRPYPETISKILLAKTLVIRFNW